jgi:hypothetical protein
MRALIRTSTRLALGMAFAAFAVPTSADTCSIRGVVSLASGQPAASVWIVLTQAPGGGERARSLSTDNGKYYLSQLQPGAYSIAARRGDKTLVESPVSCAGDVVRNIKLP